MTNIFDKFLKKVGVVDRVLIIVMLIGAVVSVSSLFRGILRGNQVQIEYLNSETDQTEESHQTIFVDIEGAVIYPGVYEFSTGSRIKDVLVKAGGYAENADREYCEKKINLAQEIKDGQKIYIPAIGDTPLPLGYSEAKSGSKLININTATIQELDTLWGVGLARAENIVKNRPYENLEDLVTKKIISGQILERNRAVMTTY